MNQFLDPVEEAEFERLLKVRGAKDAAGSFGVAWITPWDFRCPGQVVIEERYATKPQAEAAVRLCHMWGYPAYELRTLRGTKWVKS